MPAFRVQHCRFQPLNQFNHGRNPPATLSTAKPVYRPSTVPWFLSSWLLGSLLALRPSSALPPVPLRSGHSSFISWLLRRPVCLAAISGLAAYGSALLRLTSDFWSLLFLPLPTDSVDVLNQIKMPVIAENMLTVLEGKRRNPNVIFRNRSSGKTQAMADDRVLTGRLFIHRKHAAGSAKSTEANLPRSPFA